ncbi:AMP-dependent synthetase [Actinomadura sp. KC06]|uniref:AMP-binding protein n=1 Tax=Actinomadura sp. KC06 TaxID=2530369 RepID=UPI00104318CE|nr:AMP-binding protein [Actinomadura sp. KC06]TDD34949.1 AMP-dependent synthetase [Actinomadura sp. KC06]
MIDRLVSGPPPGGRIRFAGLSGTTELALPDLYRRSGHVARYLLSQGVRAGDRIGILAANGLEWVLLDLAALRLKVETAGLEPGKFRPTPELMAAYGMRLLFTDQHAAGPGIVPIGDVPAAAEGGGAPLPEVRYAPDDVTTIKFTSGSTGPPKGLAATVGSIDGSLAAVQEIFQHVPGDDLFVFLPLSLLQQRYWIYSALLHGHDVTLTNYVAAMSAMARTRPTVVMGVPAFFDTARLEVERRAGSTDPEALREAARELFGGRIRYLWTGSAPANPATLSFFDDCGLPIYEGYGLNETCIATKNHPGAHRRGSVGRAVRGKEILIDADGVINVRSDRPVNTRYAYAEPGASERIFLPGGIVRTGDLGRLDEDGYLYVLGRADDTIVLGNGKKVVVRPVEERMKAHPAIAECVVYCPGETELVAVVSPARVPADTAAIAAHLDEVNRAGDPDERLRRVVVAAEPFSIANGLLTSQYKPKRRQVYAAHADQIADPKEGVHAH